MSPEARAFAGDQVPPGPKPIPDEKSVPELEPADTWTLVEASAEDGDAAGVTAEPDPEANPEPAHPHVAVSSGPPHVLIIGGGGTGGALAHDLVLRGLRVTLVERGEVTSGATGRHHGLLHSGARYVTTDRAAAVECVVENKLLRRIAPGSLEENDGLFVALTDEDAEFEKQFTEACWQCALPNKRLTRDEALRLEPGLNPGLLFAIQVPDATMDAMRLPLRFFATARRNGADVRPFTEVVGITTSGRTVTGAKVRDIASGREYEIGADVVVNAAGPWVGRVAGLAGVKVGVTLSPGVLLAVAGRRCNMVVNRLHPPGDGDIVVPQRGRTILGTTSWIADDPAEPVIPTGHVETILRETSALLPGLAQAEILARWTAVRPLVTSTAGRGRGPAREIECIDHAADRKPTDGLVTIAGGKATTMRAMAEAAANTVCAKLGVDEPCRTGEVVLLPHTAWYNA